MKQEKKFEGEYYCKSQLLQLLKKTNTHECFHKPVTYWKWTPFLTISTLSFDVDLTLIN